MQLWHSAGANWCARITAWKPVFCAGSHMHACVSASSSSCTCYMLRILCCMGSDVVRLVCMCTVLQACTCLVYIPPLVDDVMPVTCCHLLTCRYNTAAAMFWVSQRNPHSHKLAIHKLCGALLGACACLLHVTVSQHDLFADSACLQPCQPLGILSKPAEHSCHHSVQQCTAYSQ